MKGYRMWIVLGLALCFVPALAQAANLVENGGFEYDMYGWTVINELGNTLATEDNAASYTAIEGGRNLHVVITNADPENAWKTSVKYPIAVIMAPGEKWLLKLSVKKMSLTGRVSAGLMDNRPPWSSLFWTGDIDLANRPIGAPVDFSFEFEIPYDLWYPAVVINLAGENQDLRLDDVRVYRKSEDVLPATSRLSGKVVNKTTSTAYRLYVVAYPEGDATWGDKGAIIAPVNKTTMSWAMDVPAGDRYTLELLDKTTTVYRRPTKPWFWDVSASSPQISGIDFTIVCRYYKSSTSWLTLQDACYQ